MRYLSFLAALLCATASWAENFSVNTDSELRSAIQNDGANITVTGDIELTNSTLEITGNRTVTINLGNHTLDRKLTKRGAGGGQVFTVRSGATLILRNGILKGGWGGAGGALLNNGGTVELTNVTITGNTADDSGGGIFNEAGGTLTMVDCTVTDNHCNKHQNDSGGGGIYNAGTLKMQGANIVTDNTLGDAVDNLYLLTGTVITVTGALTGSNIGVNLQGITGIFTSDYLAYNNFEPSAYFTSDDDVFYDVTRSSNEACVSVTEIIGPVFKESDLRKALLIDGANIQLGADINLSNSTLEVTGNRTITLDMNTFALDRNLTERGKGGGQVFTVRSGATLNLSNGTLTGGWGGDGGALLNEGGTAELTNVNITGNTADDRGGGICNRLGSTLTIKDCAVANNTSNDQTANTGGGGIFNAGTLIIDGGSITNNNARTRAGGILNTGTVQVKGAITVTGNKMLEDINSNMVLDNYSPFIVIGSLEGSQIGITAKFPIQQATSSIYYANFTNDYNVYNSGIDPATIFSSDISFYGIGFEYNEACLEIDPSKDVYYIDRHWDDEQKKVVSEVKWATNVQFISKDQPFPHVYGQYTEEYWLEKGMLDRQITYVILGDVTVNGYLRVRDDGCYPKIVLTDGCRLTVTKGIFVETEIENARTLSIYGQMNNSGVLYVHTTSAATDSPGIGSRSPSAGVLNICGGTIDAKGDGDAPGIGASIGFSNTYSLFKHLNIYGGNITAQGSGYCAGIGAAYHLTKYGPPDDYGHIKIYGGTINAQGGDNGGAGIGGGFSTIHIYGGHINATGKAEAAGIGCGEYFTDDNNKPGPITIEGGKIFAYGDKYAAGIGGGDGVNGGNVTITGGEIYAYGGTDAAGIGGGEGGDGGTVNISDGYVYAQGGSDYGAGIGGGEDADGGSVTITGGTVIAKAGHNEDGYWAIGPGKGGSGYGSLTLGNNMMVRSSESATPYTAGKRKDGCRYHPQAFVDECTHENSTYTIDGTGPTNHHTQHCPYCATTFEAEPHDFSLGSTCRVCGVEATAFSLRVYVPKDQGEGTYDGHTYDGSLVYQFTPDTKVTLPACPTIIPGMDFVGWEESTVSINPYDSPYTSYEGDLLHEGDEYTVASSVSFVARYDAVDVTLYDNADNAETLSMFDGRVVNSIFLSGRTLRKNGQWNTLCLPFDVTLAGSPLEGATVKTLESTSFDDGTLTLNFTDDANNLTSIEAGKSYIVRWTADFVIDSEEAWNTFAENVNSGTNTYEGKTVLMISNVSVSTMVGTEDNFFKGTFDGQGYTLTFTKTTTEKSCAPFRYVDGATIKNLHINGTITTSDQFAAGFIAYSKGATTISNCRSSVTISSTIKYDDGTHGGFIARILYGSVNFTDCLFDGTLTGSTTNRCGGFVGWTETDNGASVTFTNCFFNPALLNLDSSYCRTFARIRSGSPTINNSYYRTLLGAVAQNQGTDATDISDGDLLNYLGSGWEYVSNNIVPKMSSDVVTLTFSIVTIDNTKQNVETEFADFIGSFSPVEIDGEDRTILYLGAGNKLYYPSQAMTINACRAYFKLKDIKVGDQPNEAHSFNINFGEDETTAIHITGARGKEQEETWYDLQGRKLTGKPTQKGVYIHNGKKIVNKS